MTWSNHTRAYRLLALSGCLLALLLAAGGYPQSPTIKRIGIVAVSVSDHSEQAEAFRAGLHDAG